MRMTEPLKREYSFRYHRCIAVANIVPEDVSDARALVLFVLGVGHMQIDIVHSEKASGVEQKRAKLHPSIQVTSL